MDKNNKKTLRSSKVKTVVNPSTKRYESAANEEQKEEKLSNESDLITTLLSGSNEEHYKIFKKIITDENIIFNSWFIASRFDMSALKNYCDTFELKITLTLSDDPDVKLPDETMKQVSKKSSIQLAIDRFFSFEEQDKNLRELYQIITSDSDKTGLGYFVFESNSNRLLGGGALVIVDDETTLDKKADLALHILEQHRGIGNLCLQKLFKIGFEEKNIDEIWNRPAKENIDVANFMSKHGLIIKEDRRSREEFYFINKSIYESLKR